MSESEEIERFQLILENLEDLGNILDILHCEVSELKKTLQKIDSKLSKLEGGESNPPTSPHPMFG
tara:strand:+ start:2434 stop:2628 length:195 start_codon:yes stop_codon:yes gene_type:complete